MQKEAGWQDIPVIVITARDLNAKDHERLKMRLELLGEFEVLTAEDGEKGCEMAAAERPDIILMDLEMPSPRIATWHPRCAFAAVT